MIYKRQVQGLLEALDGKVRLIENVSNGIMKMDSQQVNDLISQTKKIVEQLSNLISIERD